MKKFAVHTLATGLVALAGSSLAHAQVGGAVPASSPASSSAASSARSAPAQPAAGTQTAAQRLMGDINPKLAELTDNVLFGDVWARPGLSKRDRSLATISALIAMNRPEQLRSHIAIGRQNGLTEAEIVEVITHMAFYAGWPSAVTAVGVARDVFKAQP